VHKLTLISKLARVVVISISVLALEEHLANKVKRIRTAADATIGSVKIYLLRNCGDSRVVITCVIKHKVANSTGVDTKLLQRLANNFSYLLAAISAC
jgi:hypothetical protein